MTFPKRENFQKPTNHELIVVGSKNPVKISCTQEGFMQAFDRTFSISGVQAASEVSDQPMGLEETLLGAKNRAKNASNFSTSIEEGGNMFPANLKFWQPFWLMIQVLFL